jgi:hypothetical protein
LLLASSTNIIALDKGDVRDDGGGCGGVDKSAVSAFEFVFVLVVDAAVAAAAVLVAVSFVGRDGRGGGGGGDSSGSPPSFITCPTCCADRAADSLICFWTNPCRCVSGAAYMPKRWNIHSINGVERRENLPVE